jgi:hypothetical protein
MKVPFRNQLVAIAACACAQAGVAQIAYPGSTWGVLMYPAGLTPAEKENTLLAGRVEQGIDWFRFGDEQWKFNTYAALAYSVDNQGLDYNNKLTPAIGMKVSRTFESGVLDFGLQAIHERRWKTSASNSGAQVYVSWWFGWDARRLRKE